MSGGPRAGIKGVQNAVGAPSCGAEVDALAAKLEWVDGTAPAASTPTAQAASTTPKETLSGWRQDAHQEDAQLGFSAF